MDRRHQRARVGVAAMAALLSLAGAACAGGPAPSAEDRLPPGGGGSGPDLRRGAAGAGGPARAAEARLPPGGVVSGPDLRRAAALQPFDSCPDVLRWFQDEAVARLGPYGDGLAAADRYLQTEDAVGVAPLAESR